MVVVTSTFLGGEVGVRVLALNNKDLVTELGCLGCHTAVHFVPVIVLEDLVVDRQHVGTVLDFERLGMRDWLQRRVVVLC